MSRVGVVLVALLLATVAAADTQEAKKHYERGMKAYNLLDFKSALKEFQTAYVEQPDPIFLFNIAQCQRQLKNYDAAGKSYRLYLANSPDAPNREQVRRLIDDMEARAQADQHAKPPAEAQPPSAAQTTPTQPAQATSPSAPSMEVRAAPAAPPRWYTSRPGWILSGSGIFLLGAGAGLLGAAVGEHNAAVSATTQTAFDDHHANSIHFQQAGWPLLGVGGALVVAGVTVFALHAKGHR